MGAFPYCISSEHARDTPMYPGRVCMGLGFGSGMMLHKVKMDDTRKLKLKVICIVCKSKGFGGRCRCATVERWTPQPPKLA